MEISPEGKAVEEAKRSKRRKPEGLSATDAAQATPSSGEESSEKEAGRDFCFCRLEPEKARSQEFQARLGEFGLLPPGTGKEGAGPDLHSESLGDRLV